MRADPGLCLQHQDLSSRARERARDCQPDDARADDDGVELRVVSHGCGRPPHAAYSAQPHASSGPSMFGACHTIGEMPMSPAGAISGLKIAATAAYLVAWPSLLLWLSGDAKWLEGWVFSAWFVTLCATSVAWLYRRDPEL